MLLFIVFKREQTALPAHGHIIEEPEEDYRGKEIKQGLGGKKTTALAKKKKKKGMKQQPE